MTATSHDPGHCEGEMNQKRGSHVNLAWNAIESDSQLARMNDGLADTINFNFHNFLELLSEPLVVNFK
jgi:hypothetical protein